MNTHGRLVTIAAVTLSSLLLPGAAFADVVGLWHMDEDAGATQMLDSAGGNDNGTLTSVTTGVAGLVSGKAYQLNGASSRVTVLDVADRFDPLNKPITIKATFRIANGPMRDDSYELIRKGYTTTQGGEWKMEIQRSRDATVGKLHCVFRGTLPDGRRPVAQIQANLDLVDGRNHTVSCTRTATSVIARVDSKTFSVARTTGSIQNSEPVMIGCKVAGDDVFNGFIDEVSVNIG